MPGVTWKGLKQIKENGTADNVGIGTTAPAYPLHVQTGNTGNWNGGFDGNSYGVWARAVYGAPPPAPATESYGANTAYGTEGYLGWNSYALYA